MTFPTEEYRLIPLSRGYSAIVDTADYERCAQFKWSTYTSKFSDGTVNSAYGFRRIKNNGKWTTQKLHRFILELFDPIMEVDHIDHNGLNCRRNNMRVATRQENMRNVRKRITSKSKFKGVIWNKQQAAWQSKITINGKTKHLGFFLEEERAAIAYDNAAKIHFGEFAHFNLPNPSIADHDIHNRTGSSKEIKLCQIPCKLQRGGDRISSSCFPCGCSRVEHNSTSS